jgi:TRAP transporter 4TM/12TM fusion protein
MMKKIDIIIVIVGVSASLYHMIYSQYLVQDYVSHLNTHLGFGLLLVFLCAIQEAKKIGSRISSSVLLLCALLGIIYVHVNVDQLQDRAWFNTTLDLAIGIMLVLLVLRATWRAFGVFIPIIAIIAVIYPFVGHYLPEPFYCASLSFEKTIANLSICMSRGIYGTPLSISATYIFLWMVFGSMLQATGGVEFFLQLGRMASRKFRSGPAIMSVFTSALIGMITGSTSANIVLDGTFTIPAMKKAGFSAEQAGAIEAAASNGGQIMPPVMGAAAFTMAGMTGIPYLHIALMAVIPAILYFYCCGLYVVLLAERERVTPSIEKVDVKELFLSAPLFIIPLGGILVFLVLGYTVMFVGFWAIAILVGLSFVRKKTRPSLKTLITGLVQGAITGGQIAVMLACAGLIVTSFTMTGLGVKMSSGIEVWSGGNLFVALLIISSICIIMGMMGITVSAYIIVAMVAGPSLMTMGLNLAQAHFFIMFVSVFAFVTPPVAMGSLVASKLAGADYVKTAIESCKATGAAFILPLLLIYCPIIILQPQDPLSAVMGIIAALIFLTAFEIGLVGYAWRKCGSTERIFWGVAAIISILHLVLQSYVLFAIGIIVFGLLIFYQRKRILRERWQSKDALTYPLR